MIIFVIWWKNIWFNFVLGITQALPGCRIFGCFFHLMQSIQRQCKSMYLFKLDIFKNDCLCNKTESILLHTRWCKCQRTRSRSFESNKKTLFFWNRRTISEESRILFGDHIVNISQLGSVSYENLARKKCCVLWYLLHFTLLVSLNVDLVCIDSTLPCNIVQISKRNMGAILCCWWKSQTRTH